MNIDIKKLKYSGKDSLDFSFDYELKENYFEICNARIDNLIKIEGYLELHNDTVYIDLTVNCTIVGECARCLEQTKYNFNVSESVTYVQSNPKEDEYLYKCGVVNLEPAVNDIILSNIPYRILCKEDCKGICYKCGVNLNNEKCKCKI